MAVKMSIWLGLSGKQYFVTDFTVLSKKKIINFNMSQS